MIVHLCNGGGDLKKPLLNAYTSSQHADILRILQTNISRGFDIRVWKCLHVHRYEGDMYCIKETIEL